jgi:hypothetical protein
VSRWLARTRASEPARENQKEVTRMALLDIQELEPTDGEWGHRGGGSSFSLLLCDSTASVTLC